MATKKARTKKPSTITRRPRPSKAPSLSTLGRQLARTKCDHLMGREVIAKQIEDLAMARMDAGYCQNWNRCPTNGWGKCTPDSKKWVSKLRAEQYKSLFSAAELRAIESLKIKKM